jgi:uncharacterized protein YciI
MKLLNIACAVSLCSALLAGCSATPATPGAPGSPREAMRGYTLVQIHTGPMSGKLDKAANDAAFAGHFANMERLAGERKLLVAGPYGKQRHDTTLRGLFVLGTTQRAQAMAWAGTDPTTQAGVFTLAYHDLQTDAPLLRALEEDLAWRADLAASGVEPGPGEGARPYVLLTAEQGDLALRELAALAAPGRFLLARLDATRAFALLDAETEAAARERFAPQLAALGECALDEWYASRQLANLPAWLAR